MIFFSFLFISCLCLFILKPESKSWSKIESAEPPSTRSGSVSWVDNATMFILGGFRGEGGFEHLCDLWSFKDEQWKELDIEGSLPVCARPTPSPVIDTKTNTAWFYGGWDGKTPLGNLLAFDLSHPAKWKNIPMELEFDMESLSLTAKGTKGLKPIPRYGHVMVMKDGIITIALGSGSMYLDDLFQIDTVEEEE